MTHPFCAAACAPPSASVDEGTTARSLRAVEPFARGPAFIVVTVAVFAAADALGARPGLALASAWLSAMATYCVANFWHCRETHCGVTGPGWALLAAVGFAATLAPVGPLAWFSVDVQITAAVAILVIGYCLEWAVAAKTGERHLQRQSG